MIRIGVIGCGYWGPNLVRNFSESEAFELVTCCDLDPKRLLRIGRRYPALHLTKEANVILEDPTIDAVAIATPLRTHYELAKAALEKGKHVFLEKPMAATAEQASELVELAEKHDRKLMVDHIFVYTSAVRKIKELIDQGELGEVYYFDSVRINLGLFQHDVNVVWDLAIHDLSIIDFLFQRNPSSISALGVCHTGVNGHENIAYVALMFEDTVIAHIHVNWLAPAKVRTTLIGGSKKMIVYDDTEPSEKLKVYDKGIQLTQGEGIYKTLIDYRTGDMYAPKLDQAEGLKTAVDHFADCILHHKMPLTDGRVGLRIVRILEAIQRSMKNQGRIEKIWSPEEVATTIKAAGEIA